ncbi:MAG: N-acetylglucosamine kinase-like BadF-type ATPase [Bacteroidia bacterium]|jgi:N-acetylglucosamine kinase-like BadF-type ATPase
MKLIADSGSTKCDWMIVGDDTSQIAKTIGFNPFFHNQEFIESHLIGNDLLNAHSSEIDEIYYYGAGCSSGERNKILINALTSVFSNAKIIKVSEDLDGAAFAACGHNKGIVCIIGTGSNSCYFDGKDVHSRIPALGYVLGDEGSGSYFGKYMLSHFLYKTMPDYLAKQFQETYNIDKESILFSIYNKPNANVYLASFMKFASANRTEPWIKQMIYIGLSTFAKIHIQSHPEYKNVPVNFVGSIAHYFKDALDLVARDLGFTVGEIVKKPIEALAAFHN